MGLEWGRMIRRISTKWVLAVLVAVIVPFVGFAWLVNTKVSDRMAGDVVRYHLMTMATELANRIENLKTVIVDCSFPNAYEELAVTSGHMTPRLLVRDLAKLKRDCDILIYHIKPMYEETVIAELDRCHIPRLVARNQSRTLTL